LTTKDQTRREAVGFLEVEVGFLEVEVGFLEVGVGFLEVEVAVGGNRGVGEAAVAHLEEGEAVG
jgi:hypothetical protein